MAGGARMESPTNRTPRDGTVTVATTVLRKLRGRSASELRARGLQVANTWLERLGLSGEVGEPNDARFWRRLSPEMRRTIPAGDAGGLLAAFRAGPNRFFAAFDDSQATVAELRRRWPRAEREIVARADAICAGVFDLLGYDRLSFGSPIDWHRDPVAGRVAPRVHWSRIDYLDPTLVGDHKVIWELNRHQYFLTLGRAYWLTRDERYARTITEHLQAWMDANPPKIGVNWASSLESAYRAISWIWALSFLRDSAVLSPQLYRRVLAYIDLHARHIARNLSTYFSPNTHLTGEALGLLTIGSCFPELAASDAWKRIGRTVLESEMERQVRPDGVYVEQSPHYHRYTLEIYLHAVILARRAGRPLQGVDARLQAALEHAMWITMPDGSCPLIGDDDGGQLLPLEAGPPSDLRPALATGAVVYQRGDYAAVAGSSAEQALWLLGPRGLMDFDRLTPALPHDTSRAFADGGWYVMRDGWSRDSNFALVDLGPHGFLSGGHAHADALSFVLCVDGRQLFIDPGTCVYSSSGHERDHYRETAAHNTITVDARSSSEPGIGAFQWRHMATSELGRWTSDALYDFVRGEHDGFMRLSSPVRHERSILFVKHRYWVIRDRLIGKGDHQAVVRFRCAPNVEATLESGDEAIFRMPDDGTRSAVRLRIFAPSGSLLLRQDCLCPVYGRKEAATVCEYRLNINGTTDLLTFVLPIGVRDSRVTQRAPGTFAVDGDDLSDVHAFGDAAGVELGEHGWVWIRRDPETTKTVDRIVVDGTAVSTQSRGEQREPDRDRDARAQRLAGTSRAS